MLLDRQYLKHASPLISSELCHSQEYQGRLTGFDEFRQKSVTETFDE